MGKRKLSVVRLGRGIWKQPRITGLANSWPIIEFAFGAHWDVASLQRCVTDLCRDASALRFPFSGKSMPSVSLYKASALEALRAFLPMPWSREKPPTDEHGRACRRHQAVADRARGTGIGRSGPISRGYSAAFRAWLPRHRASQVSKWTIELFKLLVWSHVCAYFCFEFQNAMAALIDGLICYNANIGIAHGKIQHNKTKWI